MCWDRDWVWFACKQTWVHHGNIASWRSFSFWTRHQPQHQESWSILSKLAYCICVYKQKNIWYFFKPEICCFSALTKPLSAATWRTETHSCNTKKREVLIHWWFCSYVLCRHWIWWRRTTSSASVEDGRPAMSSEENNLQPVCFRYHVSGRSKRGTEALFQCKVRVLFRCCFKGHVGNILKGEQDLLNPRLIFRLKQTQSSKRKQSGDEGL